MNEIIPNFYGLPGMLVGRVYVIKDADGLTLIDTAVPPAGKRIIKAIQAAGYQASDIKRVMLTHAHPDHFGGLRAVVEATGAEVVFQPRYSPEFNAIEMCWSWIKHDLRRIGCRAIDRLVTYAERRWAEITPTLCRAWARGCGYAV